MTDPKSIHMPFNFVLDLEDSYVKTYQGKFANEDFHATVNTLIDIVGERQKETMELFRKLSKREVLSRVRAISKLNKALQNIEKRKHVISHSPPTQK
jgi:hypothetical protein